MNIVVGFLDTPEGHAAVDRAIEEAKLRGGRLVVVHSLRGGHRQDESVYIEGARALEALQERLTAEGIEHSTHEYVRDRSPAKDIEQAVEDHQGELIIIGIRTRSTTGKLLLGSNALEILHDATVPVLCVKAARD